MKVIKSYLNMIDLLCSKLPEDIIALLARIAIASVFWRSVQTKVNGWDLFGQSFKFFNMNSSTTMLFRYEYNVPLLSYTQAAYTATFAEFFFSIMLLLGIATRVAAFGLLGVTAVIQIFVFPESWSVHILWLAVLLYILKYGGGRIALEKCAFTVVK